MCSASPGSSGTNSPRPGPATPDTGSAPSPRPGTTLCCWPIGDPGTPGFRFCDAVALAARPYCAAHCGQAYRKAPKLLDDAAACCGWHPKPTRQTPGPFGQRAARRASPSNEAGRSSAHQPQFLLQRPELCPRAAGGFTPAGIPREACAALATFQGELLQGALVRSPKGNEP